MVDMMPTQWSVQGVTCGDLKDDDGLLDVAEPSGRQHAHMQTLSLVFAGLDILTMLAGTASTVMLGT